MCARVVDVGSGAAVVAQPCPLEACELKEACKVVQSRLGQASPEKAQENSVPKADDVTQCMLC